MKSKMYTFWMKEEPDQLAKSKIWSWYPEPWRSQHLALLGCKSTIRLGGFHHEVISSEQSEDFTHRQVDLIKKLTSEEVSFFGRGRCDLCKNCGVGVII